MNTDLNTDGNIDCVAMMREIRDALSRKTEGMTWEEEKEFLKKSITSFGFITDRKSGEQARAGSADFPSLLSGGTPARRRGTESQP
uniref:Uncharacterized protein n=1 Tax=Candidatus Kentrum sp. DK TaxID=2126562 RepID=A0A450SKN5_9GAMM|nr:MAG: hypothetical protein BECKDK2373C_GA0170839_104213 [Candidatus Kentron sp. DK]